MNKKTEKQLMCLGLIEKYKAEYHRTRGHHYPGTIKFVRGKFHGPHFEPNTIADFQKRIAVIESWPTVRDTAVDEEMAALVKLSLDATEETLALIKMGKYTQDSPKAKELWKRAEALSERVGPGPNVGKLLKFSVNDGWAFYLIYKVGKDITTVLQLHTPDGYSFEGEVNGKIMTAIVERNLRYQNLLNFNKK